MGLLYHLEKAPVKHGTKRNFVMVVVDVFAPDCTLTSDLLLHTVKSAHARLFVVL